MKAFLITAALIAVAVVSISTAVWMIGAANTAEGSYKQFAKDSAKADDDRAAKYIARGCGPLPRPARDKCIADQHYAAHQAQHDDRDLEAQRTTAVWTRYLGIAGILGTAFGIVGVLLVLLTFWEARKTGRGQLRAYVHPIEFHAPKVDSTHPFKVKVVLANKGQTPAYKLECTIQLATRELPLPKGALVLEEFEGEKSVQSLAANEPMHVWSEFEKPFSPRLADAINRETKGLFCFGQIIYTDVFGKPHTTNFRTRWNADDRTFSGCEEGNEAD